MIQQEIPIIESVDIQTEIAFNNLCLQDGGGKEQRIILWQDPIRTFNLHKEIVYPVQLNALREFFGLTKGSLESFFYRDKSDWQASRFKQLRSDVQTYGTLYGLGNDEYQTCKAYQVGSTIYLRPIACPFNLALFNGETVVTGWTLGDNGKVTFSGTFNSVSFDFYVPVRFETDDLERQITAKSEPDNYVVYSIPKLVLKEVKIDFDDNVVDTFQKNLDHTLSLDLLKGSEIVQYQTDILFQESGFEKRSLVQEIPTTINNLQARNIVYQDDIEYLIALWLCVKGEGAGFYFDNGFETNRVRFVSKALSYTCQSNALVYSLGGIGVRELPPLLIEGFYYGGMSVDRYRVEGGAEVFDRVTTFDFPMYAVGETEEYRPKLLGKGFSGIGISQIQWIKQPFVMNSSGGPFDWEKWWLIYGTNDPVLVDDSLVFYVSPGPPESISRTPNIDRGRNPRVDNLYFYPSTSPNPPSVVEFSEETAHLYKI